MKDPKQIEDEVNRELYFNTQNLQDGWVKQFQEYIYEKYEQVQWKEDWDAIPPYTEPNCIPRKTNLDWIDAFYFD